MTSLSDMSAEVLHNILKYVSPKDLPSLSNTCSPFKSYIADNKLLFKDVYIENLGCPPESQDRDWETEVRNVIKMLRLLKSDNMELKRNNLDIVANVIITMMKTTKCQSNIPLLEPYFKSKKNVDAFLAASSLFKHAGSSTQKPAATEALRQVSAQLHCLYGVPIDCPSSSSYLRDDIEGRTSHRALSPARPSNLECEGRRTRSQMISIPTNSYARSKVYDLRQYSAGSFWGPFKSDGTQDVDWEKMEAIMVVLGYNLRMFLERAQFEIDPMWEKPWIGAQKDSYVSQPDSCFDRTAVNVEKFRAPSITAGLDEQRRLDELDPYGISGTWMRVVCFLDYHDFYAFNFARPPPAQGEPREPIDTREAIRMIKLKLRVTKIEESGEEDGKDYPIVWFEGTSWSLHNSWDPNANSAIRGVVRQTPQGEIRWTTWSIFHGEERWRSEGVQIGGPRSGRGVLGNWFDKDYDVHGPAGPTAFWKLKDEYDEEELQTPPDLHDFAYLGGNEGESSDSD
ncbi:hypothetical protein AAFC00_001918 [Neodothiora populina]|uniref:F-box domain-containing protein n=1 Tax=Neodothiora populina TaxID=2781224 RepID=A0ABR3PQW3_9PEZI